MKKPVTAVIVTVLTVGVVGIAAVDAGSTAQGASARSSLSVMAPAAPGGGWDTFARESQQAMRENDVTNNAQVFNVPGAGGTIGLSTLMQMEGRDNLLMVTGGVMIGATELSRMTERVDDTTPIARLADDFNVLVVPANSELETLDDLVREWADNPGGTAIAGGSLGSIDHLLTGMLADEIGLDPRDMNYIAYSGGGEVLTAMLSNTAVAGISGYTDFEDQIEAGTLRALGFSAPEPVDGIDLPTFIEGGVDVSMSNWRGFVAPPGVDDETRAVLVEMVTEMRNSAEWRDALERNNWVDTFTTGPEFDQFVRDESDQIAQTVEDLGL